ncbi:MAG: hypothetical protein V2A62_04945 [Candidatus Woesearchaeota archaeon]
MKKEAVKRLQLVLGIVFLLITIAGIYLTLEYFSDRGVFSTFNRANIDPFLEERMSVTNTTNERDIVFAKQDMALVMNGYIAMQLLFCILLVLETILLLYSVNLLIKGIS